MKKVHLTNIHRWLIAVLLLMLSVGLLYARTALNTRLQAVKTDGTSREQMQIQMDALETEVKILQQTVTDSGKEIANLNDKKDEYIAILSTLCRNNNLTVNKLTVEEQKQDEGSLYVLPVQIELQGSLPQIQAFLSSISQADYLCRVQDVSLRTQKDFSWLWRQVDEDTFVPWWDISGAQASDQQQEVPAMSEITPPGYQAITVNDLIDPSTVLCYIKMDYLGWGNGG